MDMLHIRYGELLPLYLIFRVDLASGTPRDDLQKGPAFGQRRWPVEETCTKAIGVQIR